MTIAQKEKDATSKYLKLTEMINEKNESRVKKLM